MAFCGASANSAGGLVCETVVVDTDVGVAVGVVVFVCYAFGELC